MDLITRSPCLTYSSRCRYYRPSAAVYVALHTAADDVLMGGHDAGAAVVDEFEPFGQRRAAAGEQFDRFIAGVLCSEPNTAMTKPLSCRWPAYFSSTSLRCCAS